MELTPKAKSFILHWGEMGARWGVNRTIAQIHALLYLSPAPMTAEDVAETLQVARSNVSTSLRELQNWGVIRTVHELGDRRDHYEALGDVWEMFRLILDERKRREVDPTLAMLNQCLEESDDAACSDYERERLESMQEFFESISMWYGQVRKMPPRTLVRFLNMGAAVQRLLGVGGASGEMVERLEAPEPAHTTAE